MVPPSYAVTATYGNDYFLFASAAFWLLLPITLFLSLAPRFIFKGYKAGYLPDDIDIVRAIRKKDPFHDFSQDHDARLGIALHNMRKHQRVESTPIPSGRASRASSLSTIEPIGPHMRHSIDVRCASRTDIPTGIVSVDRGFNFSVEEQGVAMRRIQTNLSERRFASNRDLGQTAPTTNEEGRKLGHVFSLRRGILKKGSLSLGRKSHTDPSG